MISNDFELFKYYAYLKFIIYKQLSSAKSTYSNQIKCH